MNKQIKNAQCLMLLEMNAQEAKRLSQYLFWKIDQTNVQLKLKFMKYVLNIRSIHYFFAFQSISAYSGHYRPTDDRLDSFLSFLQENGVYLNEVQIHRASEDYESSEDIRVTDKGTEAEILTQSEHQPEIETGEEGSSLPESAQNLSENYYRRSLSGGLQSARAEVPKKKILQRINSKVAARSYQLGHQLSLKWTTGAGPRIGCVADYPEELRVQALEFVNLSPRVPLTPAASV